MYDTFYLSVCLFRFDISKSYCCKNHYLFACLVFTWTLNAYWFLLLLACQSNVIFNHIALIPEDRNYVTSTFKMVIVEYTNIKSGFKLCFKDVLLLRKVKIMLIIRQKWTHSWKQEILFIFLTYIETTFNEQIYIHYGVNT